jgi:hypothetical protein
VPRIDRHTFLRAFPLPGLLGERLFTVFDSKADGAIDWAEFAVGLAVVCRGTAAARRAFAFRVFDVTGAGVGVSAADLRTGELPAWMDGAYECRKPRVLAFAARPRWGLRACICVLSNSLLRGARAWCVSRASLPSGSNFIFFLFLHPILSRHGAPCLPQC